MKVNPHEEKCHEALSGLVEWINKLLDLANEIMESTECSEDDHLGFMALCFLNRQIDHIQSIVMLVPNRDTSLIARSMMEGLCQILWAAQKPTELPLKWRTFAYIHDWRLQQVKIGLGELIDPNQEKSNEIGLRKYGQLFYTKDARSAISQKQQLPSDPYHKSWTCGTQVTQIFDCVSTNYLLKEIYSSFSDWHHWGTAGIAETLSWHENKLTFSSSSSSNSAMALTMGFLCLLQTIELTNEHLSFARESQIALIRDGYIKWHQDRDCLSSSTTVRT
jgi:hypothetical protein